MNGLISFFQQHPYAVLAATSAATWIFNNVISILVSNLPAPTKDSTARYVYWFKVLNQFIGNLKRAKSTAIEQSPNWQDAVEKYMQQKALARKEGIPQ